MTTISGSRVWICAAGCASIMCGSAVVSAQTLPVFPPSTAAAVNSTSSMPSASSAQVAPASVQSPAGASNGGGRNLFADLAADFTRLLSSDAAKWLGIGASMALVGHVGDRDLSRALSGARLDEAFESGQVLGGAPLQFGGAVVTYAIGRIAGSSRTAQVGAELLRAQIVAQAMTSIVKVSVGRSRPDGTSYSFPSGHTSTAFASATVLQRNFGWKAGIPAYAVASYVGVSRIQTQRHYLSDVAFGAALGILAGRTVTVGRGDSRFAVAPFGVEGGAGIGFSLVGKP